MDLGREDQYRGEEQNPELDTGNTGELVVQPYLSLVAHRGVQLVRSYSLVVPVVRGKDLIDRRGVEETSWINGGTMLVV